MKQVLVVDDQENNRLLVEDALMGEGYTLVQAGSGEEALQIANNDHFDLILCDIQMPEMDGYETLQKLKSNPATANIPVIMLTALGMDSQVAESLNEGAIDHITKPFSALVLRARLKSLFRSNPGTTTESPSQAKKNKLISVIGSKGGVGTTTVAINMAALLAEGDPSVGFAELRPSYGTASLQLGISATENLATLIQKKQLIRSDVEKAVLYHRAGFSALLGPGHKEILPSIPLGQCEKLLNILQSMNAYTVLDLGSNPTDYNALAWRNSYKILMVVEPEPTSLEAAQFTLERIRAAGASANDVHAILLNRAPRSNTPKFDAVQKCLGCKLVGSLPYDTELCSAAVINGLPLVLQQPQALLSSMLRSIASKLPSKDDAPLPQPT